VSIEIAKLGKHNSCGTYQLKWGTVNLKFRELVHLTRNKYENKMKLELMVEKLEEREYYHYYLQEVWSDWEQCVELTEY